VRAVVVGGGAVGLSVARGLSLRGHEAVVLERGGAFPDPRASSADSHRLIRYTYGDAHGYAAMVGEAYEAWERLWADLGERLHVPTGQIVTAPAGDPWVAASCRSLERLGVPYELLDGPAAAALHPALDPDRVEVALHTPTGGVLLAERIVAALAAWLRRRSGVELRAGARVASLDPERGIARLEGRGEVAGDALVVAAGAWLPRLVPGLAAAVTPSRQVVAYVRPPADLAAAWRAAPMTTDVLTAEASVFYAVPPVAGTGLKFGDHRFSRGGDPDGDREPRPEEVAGVVRLGGRLLRRAGEYEVAHARTCFYTVAQDERFVARREGRMLALSPCSGHGFKFASLIGERAAGLLAGEEDFEAFSGGWGNAATLSPLTPRHGPARPGHQQPFPREVAERSRPSRPPVEPGGRELHSSSLHE
jgi:glycine/D-amino acid oxidase-like deaminating enzyme